MNAPLKLVSVPVGAQVGIGPDWVNGPFSIKIEPRNLTPRAVRDLVQWIRSKPSHDHSLEGAPTRGFTPAQWATIQAMAPSTRGLVLSYLIGSESGTIHGTCFYMREA